jgi:4-hydroxy-3-methylbut-2-enyl diphosphate reductase
METKQAPGIGFCTGVRRAIDILERVAREQGGVETLGAVVHNQQVLHKLADIGASVVNSVDEIKGSRVVIRSHGVGPQVIDQIQSRGIDIIDATCPFVKRAQVAARRLHQSGFYTVVFGDAIHPEVKSILAWASNNGLATQEATVLSSLDNPPRRLGILSQTTHVPASYARFIKDVIDYALVKDSELRIIDTICHDIRRRQEDSVKLARESELVFVVGGHTSANSKHLVELCSEITTTHLIETAHEIRSSWLPEKGIIGITSGASTGEETIDDVVTRLKSLTRD